MDPVTGCEHKVPWGLPGCQECVRQYKKTNRIVYQKDVEDIKISEDISISSDNILPLIGSDDNGNIVHPDYKCIVALQMMRRLNATYKEPNIKKARQEISNET